MDSNLKKAELTLDGNSSAGKGSRPTPSESVGSATSPIGYLGAIQTLGVESEDPTLSLKGGRLLLPMLLFPAYFNSTFFQLKPTLNSECPRSPEFS